MWRMQLTIILFNTNIMDLVNGVTVSCRANRTDTNAKDWDVYSANRFPEELA